MPLLSRLQAFSFNTESWFSTGSFVFVKNLLLVINFLSMLAGIILIAAGGYINSNASEDIIGLSGSIAGASIGIGAVVAIISFLGCFGAANEKGTLLKTYFALLIILIILEISVGAAAYAKRDTIDSSLGTAWTNAVANNNATILNIETTFSCCGYLNVNDSPYPTNCTVIYGYTVGCREQLANTFKSSLSTIGGAGVVIGIIELVGLIFSAILFRRISAKENAQASLLNEAWRINRNKVQYGYQNYQYV